MPEVPPPESLAPIVSSARAHRADARAARSRRAFGEPVRASSPHALAGGWMRLAEPRVLDAPLARAVLRRLAARRRAAPARSPARPPGGMPTVDLTIHFRSPVPADARPDDFYLGVFRSRTLRAGFAEEDGEIWTRAGSCSRSRASSRWWSRVTTRPTTLLLVRHGEIAANAERIWHGSTDSALTERGRGEAERTARHLAQRRPRRPRSTRARCCARARPPARSPPSSVSRRESSRARGVRHRRARGRLVPGAREQHRFFEKIAADPDFAPPRGESPRQVVARVSAALAAIARAHRGEQVVVVSHGAALGLALGALIERDA